MIFIEAPEMRKMDGSVTLFARCCLPQGEKTVYLQTDDQWEPYLCRERSDAFLILLLPLAMRLGEDVTCAAPVTEELLYQLSEMFIPSLCANSQTLYPTKIFAKTAPALENVDAVGTGCSCGVDSFHAIMQHLDTPYPGMDVTHLCLYYSMVHNPKNDAVFEEEVRRSTVVAQKLGLPLIVIHTNCMDVVPAKDWFNNLHTFTGAFIALSLQKLWKTYYYASGYSFAEFSVLDSEKTDCSRYDLLTLTCASTGRLRLYSEGSERSRFDKTARIARHPIVQQHLHVCNDKADNCCVCGKCVRTMLCLDALGVLPAFGQVFDLAKYKANRDDHLRWLHKCHVRNDVINEPTYERLKDAPAIRELAQKDPVWSAISRAEGIYDDGWLADRFAATSVSGEEGRLCICVYVSGLTPENEITVRIAEQAVYRKKLEEGLHEICVLVPPNTALRWSVEPSVSLIPCETGASSDVRVLSVILSRVTVR